MGGARYERELVNALDACGYVAMRAPASGAATDRELPDVLAGRKRDWRNRLDPIANAFSVNRSHADAIEAAQAVGRRSTALAIEVKSTSATTAYADEHEITALTAFASAFGATPLVAGRFKRQGKDRLHHLVAPDDCRRTQGDAGNYGVPESSADERASYVVNATTETIKEPTP